MDAFICVFVVVELEGQLTVIVLVRVFDPVDVADWLRAHPILALLHDWKIITYVHMHDLVELFIRFWICGEDTSHLCQYHTLDVHNGRFVG